MTASNDYAVYFFPQALEVLGKAIEPFLQDGPNGPYLPCHEIDTSGALLEMTIPGINRKGDSMLLELMVPTSMVRMIVSSQSDAAFGFGPRSRQSALQAIAEVDMKSAPAPARLGAAAKKKPQPTRPKHKKRKST